MSFLPRVALAVVAKAPIPGVAKTRLGRAVGPVAAATLYQGFLLDTLATLDQTFDPRRGPIHDVARLLVCPNEPQAALLRALVGPPWSVVVQRRAGLMGGIVDACDQGFSTGSDVVVVTDADSPALPDGHVLECVRLATARDVVLGPTVDGGYYLIAAMRPAWRSLSRLLLDPVYDGATICQETLRQATHLGLTTALGPAGRDVDTAEDLRSLLDELARRPTSFLVNTRAALRAVGDPFAAGSELRPIAGESIR